MNLTKLSLQRCTPRRAPHAPTNAERLQWFRACTHAPTGNAYPWAFARRYAAEQAPPPVIRFEDRRGV